MNNNLLPIVFVSNKDYLNHLSTSIFSIAKNNLDVHINFYIINSDFTKTDLKKIERSINFHKSFSIINCQSDNKFLSEIKLKVGHINEISFLKFLIGDFVKDDKAIYIDSDTIILKSLKPLIAINLNEFCLGAVEEEIYNNEMRERVGIKKNIKTFNSGVFLIDLKKWKKFKIKQKCLEHLKKYKKHFYYLDQDSLNSVISGKFKSLDSTYNQREDPTIIHFAGKNKPWFIKTKHAYKNHYWNFRDKALLKKTLRERLDFLRIFNKNILNIIMFIPLLFIRICFFLLPLNRIKNFYKRFFRKL